MQKAHSTKKALEQEVIMGARELGINMVLFRHAVGERLGVSVTDMECLALVFFKGISSPSELARYTGLSSGATTAMLDRLEKAGLIKRRPNPHDRRGVHITIVKKTADAVAPLFAAIRKAQDALVASYSQQELELLADYLKKSSHMWEKEREKLQ